MSLVSKIQEELELSKKTQFRVTKYLKALSQTADLGGLKGYVELGDHKAAGDTYTVQVAVLGSVMLAFFITDTKLSVRQALTVDSTGKPRAPSFKVTNGVVYYKGEKFEDVSAAKNNRDLVKWIDSRLGRSATASAPEGVKQGAYVLVSNYKSYDSLSTETEMVGIVELVNNDGTASVVIGRGQTKVKFSDITVLTKAQAEEKYLAATETHLQGSRVKSEVPFKVTVKNDKDFTVFFDGVPVVIFNKSDKSLTLCDVSSLPTKGGVKPGVYRSFAKGYFTDIDLGKTFTGRVIDNSAVAQAAPAKAKVDPKEIQDLVPGDVIRIISIYGRIRKEFEVELDFKPRKTAGSNEWIAVGRSSSITLDIPGVREGDFEVLEIVKKVAP